MHPLRGRAVSAARAILTGAAIVSIACKASFSAEFSTPGGDASAEGTATATPAKPQVTIVRRGDRLAYEGGEIEFETGSAELKGDATQHVLDEFAAALERYPGLALRIEAHTDSRGSKNFNRDLSNDRARAIRTALVRRGVAGSRLDTVGHGEDRPVAEEPAACRNRSEDTVPASKLADCQRAWLANRRAAFVVTGGADGLPAEGATITRPVATTPAVATKAGPRPRRPDWALRLFGGYTLAMPDPTLHGGHFGIGVHASQRFGRRERGYIGGGPRLHYRGVTGERRAIAGDTSVALHTIGPEGDLLIGGGSRRVVGLFSLRLGLGAAIVRGTDTTTGTAISLDDTRLAGWLLGGVVVLGKITPRWSLGGHAEAGIVGLPGPAFALEVGLNAAWHFGRGRRDGI